MSGTLADQASRAGQVTGEPVKRVREAVRDGLAVVAFSAAASSALALGLMLVVHLAG